jgi:hypothetical protein
MRRRKVVSVISIIGKASDMMHISIDVNPHLSSSLAGLQRTRAGSNASSSDADVIQKVSREGSSASPDAASVDDV